MLTLDRYIAGSFLKNFLVALGLLTSVFILQQYVRDLTDAEYPAVQITIFTLYTLPEVMMLMIPPAALGATVMTLSGLNRTQELVASFSLGFGLKRIMGVIFSLVFMICCLSLMSQDIVLPRFFTIRENYKWRVMKNRPDFFLDLQQNKLWYRSDRLIYNLQRFDPQTSLVSGMSVYTLGDQFQLLQKIDAEKAKYTKDGWKLDQGTMVIFPEDDPFPYKQSFQEKFLTLRETPKDFMEIEKKVEALRLRELYKYIEKTKNAGLDTKSFEVTFHSKFSLSFIPLIMSLLGVPFSTRNRREGGVAVDLFFCLILAFVYWLMFSVSLSLGKNGTVAPLFAAWLPSLLFLGLGFYWLRRR